MKKAISLCLLLLLLLGTAACRASDGEDGGASAGGGTISLPVWPDVSTASAPALSASSAIEESGAPSSNGESSGQASSLPVSQRPNTSNYTAYTENSANAPDLHNISVRTASGYCAAGAQSLRVEVSNRTGWQIGFKASYTVEKWNGEAWEPLPMVEEPDFGDVGYLLGTGQDSYVELDLTQLAAPLEVGREYRVGLTDMICNGYAGFFTIYATFSVK